MHESVNLDTAGLLILVLFIFVFWPVTAFANRREKSRLSYLMERKDQLLQDLRDLNFEYLAGNYLEDEFLTLCTRLERDAEQLLVEIISVQREKS
jgi:hypothetical protein